MNDVFALLRILHFILEVMENPQRILRRKIM